jgi:hypothetical protein
LDFELRRFRHTSLALIGHALHALRVQFECRNATQMQNCFNELLRTV